MIITQFHRPVAYFGLSQTCSHCDQSELICAVNAHGVAFFIFTFPAGFRYEATCDNCKKHYNQNEFSPAMRKEYEHQKQVGSFRAPWWFYLGFILFGIFFLIGLLAPKE